jgi:hypothetical protein
VTVTCPCWAEVCTCVHCQQLRTAKQKYVDPKKNGETNTHKDGRNPDGLYFVASDNDQHFVHNVGTLSFSSSWTCGRAGHCPCRVFRALPNGRVIQLSNLIKEQLQAVAARRHGQWRSAVVCTAVHVLITSLASNYHMRGDKNILVFCTPHFICAYKRGVSFKALNWFR